jgi:uncharacterized protein (TIGR02391 family)
MAWDKNNIEKEEILTESPRRSYEKIRLTRIKYKENPHSFIDLRLFQRGYDVDDKTGEDIEVFYPTKKGVQFREDHFQNLIGKLTLMPSMILHPIIMEKVWPSMLQEDFDTAVFKAFKAVEIRVRTAANLPQEVVGVALMRKAFDPEKGILTDKSVPKAEREAISHFFSGSIGLYKNPHSHREVKVTFNEAFEVLLVASHLLSIVDRRCEEMLNQ